MRVGHGAPRGTHGRPAVPVGEIEVFPTGPTLARVEPVTPRAPLADPPPEERESHREFHARPGHRPGGAPATTSARVGGGTDIVRPLLVAPGAASRIVLAGDVFRLPLPHFRIDPDRIDARFLVWTVAIVDAHARPVPATLHLLGSPSMVVTVLELVPCRRLRWGRDRFVRLGVEAIDELAHRIERAA